MFKLKSEYYPTWDQPEAIKNLLKYIKNNNKYQTLWGVTWSWKTFTMANIINKIKKPTLIIAHNKTLASQLALEFQAFFPNNAVHYFVSYYDYYQPEAYVSKTDTYIEKEATINAEIDRLRHAATQSLLSRKDVIIVASVSCIYGVWDINAYKESVFEIKVWDEVDIENILKKLLLLQYKRAWADFLPWNFKVMWDLLEIYPSSMETIYSIDFFWNEITQISRRNILTWEVYEILQSIEIYPAKHTVTDKETINKIVPEIKEELKERLEYYKETKEVVKYERLKTKVEYDIEMMLEVWYVNWIENYSKYLDGRKIWEPPATLIDYFPKDFLCFVDESHMTISQIWWMYAWDRSRKENLVEAWFRLPSALDNRPLRFEEFEQKIPQMILVSATPWEYDIIRSCETKEDNLSKTKEIKNYTFSYDAYKRSREFYNFDPTLWVKWKDRDDLRIIPQVIRPTGLLDPIVEFRTMDYMADDIMEHIKEIVDNWEKMLITTLTKRSSEELTDYLLDNNILVKYLHSEIETLERIEILNDLRSWKIDVIVWVNLLREWLDLPEVTRICILDADKQGFLRSTSALIQIIGRAARNIKWTVYMYCENLKNFEFKNNKIITKEWKILDVWDYLIDENWWKKELYVFDNWKYITSEGLFISKSMKEAINITNYRRSIQKKYNQDNNIIPTTIISTIKEIWINSKNKNYSNISKKTLEKELKKLEFEMNIASSNMEYEKAALIRDQIIDLRKLKI